MPDCYTGHAPHTMQAVPGTGTTLTAMNVRISEFATLEPALKSQHKGTDVPSLKS